MLEVLICSMVGTGRRRGPFNLFAARVLIAKESTSHGRFRLWCERQARVALWLCTHRACGTGETICVSHILRGAGGPDTPERCGAGTTRRSGLARQERQDDESQTRLWTCTTSHKMRGCSRASPNGRNRTTLPTDHDARTTRLIRYCALRVSAWPIEYALPAFEAPATAMM